MCGRLWLDVLDYTNIIYHEKKSFFYSVKFHYERSGKSGKWIDYADSSECRACVIGAAPAFENDGLATPAVPAPPAAPPAAAAGVTPLFCFSMMTAGRPVIFVLLQIDNNFKILLSPWEVSTPTQT